MSSLEEAELAVGQSEQAERTLEGLVPGYGGGPDVGYTEMQFEAGSPLEALQAKANRYTELAGRLKEETKAAQERAEALEYVANLQSPKWEKKSLAERQAMAALGSQLLGNPPEPPRPSTPAMPAWLSQLTEIKGTHVPTTRREIPTPSAQAWTRLPWSKREQFAGLTEFAGTESYQDVLDRIAQMLPQPKAGAQWMPARQRVGRI